MMFPIDCRKERGLQAGDILLGGDVGMFLEQFPEVFHVADTTFLCHRFHIGFTVAEQLCRLVNLIVVDKFDERHVGDEFQFLVEGRMAHGHLVGKKLGIEVGILDMFIDDVAAAEDEQLLLFAVLFDEGRGGVGFG